MSISEEWEHLQGYLTIQKIRYRDILRYELELDEGLGEKMLKLLIQPAECHLSWYQEPPVQRQVRISQSRWIAFLSL